MKGTIKLISITNPIEGMKVVMIDKNNRLKGIGNIIEVATQPENHSYHDVEIDGKRYYAPQNLLKQIVVEYDEFIETGNGPDIFDPPTGYNRKETLPLHSDDWEVAIALIEHEVEFKKDNSYKIGSSKCLCNTGEMDNCEHFTGPPINECLLHNREVTVYAKLLLPTPVRTIEDIPEDLRHRYPVDFNGAIPPDKFWKKRHKENIRLLNEKDKEILQLVKNNNDLKDKCEKLELQLTPVEETWDDIQKAYLTYLKENKLSIDTVVWWNVWDWLKQNFHPPKRKV